LREGGFNPSDPPDKYSPAGVIRVSKQLVTYVRPFVSVLSLELIDL